MTPRRKGCSHAETRSARRKAKFDIPWSWSSAVSADSAPPREKGRFVVAVAVALLLAACASAPKGDVVRWEPIEVWKGDAAFERVKVGRPDAADPNPQIVGVDQGGRVVLVHWKDGATPRGEVVFTNPSEMTGLYVGDVDPSVPGEEIYAGGAVKGDDGGTVTQIAITPQGPRVRRVWTGTGYVHSITRIPGDAPRLLVTTYKGELHVISPAAGDGAWYDRLLWTDPDTASKDVERPKIKDAGFLVDPTGATPHEALVVWKTGRALLVDVDRPDAARFVHDEDGGLSRVSPDPDGGAYVTGYKGRVLHFVRDGATLRVECIDQEFTDSGLRGIVQGRFPLPQGGVAPLAIFGFHRLCRALSPRLSAWDATTLFRDVERGHAIEPCDLVPGNDADELVLAGYSNRIVVLVARSLR